MKYNRAILVLAYSTLISAGTSTISGAEAVCGDLGILQVTPGNLPNGVEPSDLRLCADHPLGRNRTLDPAKGASLAPLEEGDIPIQPQRVPPDSSKRDVATTGHHTVVQTSTAGRAAVRRGATNGAGPLRLAELGRGPNASRGRTVEQTDFNMAVERTVFCRVCVDVAARS